MHIIRGGLNYNMELRWDGVRSLADAMQMLKEQVARTPAPQWIRVVGGFTAHQFAEKRLPTLEEINAVAPDTPVFLLHLYDRALLNRAAVRAVGYTKNTPWLAALALGGFTLMATMIALRFWELSAGHERFMAANAFFEHIGLVGGFLLVAWHDLKSTSR
jgi:Amidohydrolase family